MPRVAHLTSVHPADDNRIVHKECRSLAAHGFEVILIAASEHTVEVPGVEVRQVATPGSRVERITRTVPAVLRAALDADADIYHFHDPELLFVGLALKARGKRVIYDAHEDVPKQVQAKRYLSTTARRVLPPFVAMVEKGIAFSLDGVVTATERVAGKFTRTPSLAVHNFPRLCEFPTEPKPYLERRPDLTYVGAMDETRWLPEMLTMASRVRAAHPQSTMILAGRIRDALVEKYPAVNTDPAVDWRGFQTRPAVATLLDEVQIGLSVLHATPAYVEAIPTKVLEYMAAGNAVVCSDFPYWRELFGEAALYVDPGDVEAATRDVLALLANPERGADLAAAGLRLAQTRYNWDAEAAKLVEFYEHCLRA